MTKNLDVIMKRWDIVNEYIKHYAFNSFLEIGHAKGEAFSRIDIMTKESVDPNAATNPTYVMTSDDFLNSMITRMTSFS